MHSLSWGLPMATCFSWDLGRSPGHSCYKLACLCPHQEHRPPETTHANNPSIVAGVREHVCLCMRLCSFLSKPSWYNLKTKA